jgi:hypothetical protein
MTSALRGQVHSGWGFFANALACTPDHLLVAQHPVDAELVVLRRDGSGASRHVLGGSSYGPRVLGLSPGGTATVLGEGRILRISLGTGAEEVVLLPPASFRDVCEVDGRILLLDEGRFLRSLEGGAVRNLRTLDAGQRVAFLGSTGGHAVMSIGKKCVAIDARDGSTRATVPIEGELHAYSVSVGPDYIVHATKRETRDGPVSHLTVVGASSFERIAEWSWPGAVHQVRATRPLIAAMLLSVDRGPVLRVRSLASNTELDIELVGPVGIETSRATPDLAATGGVIVALHDELTAVTELPTGLAQAHLAPEATDWRAASTLGGALAAVDGTGRVLSIDLPRDDATSAVRLSIGTLPSPTGGAVAKVVYAGVTPVAIVQDPQHGRLNVTQPTDGPRLATGDEIVIDKVETRSGGVVSVLAWHRNDARAAPQQHSETAWHWGARALSAAPPQRGTAWREALGKHAARLGPHRAELLRIATLHDESALFRNRFATLGIELAPGWAEDTDGLSEMMELPAARYFVIARHFDDPIYYAVDQEGHALVELTWQDGETEPLPGPEDIHELIEERIAFVLECSDGDEEESMIAQLRADLDVER